MVSELIEREAAIAAVQANLTHATQVMCHLDNDVHDWAGTEKWSFAVKAHESDLKALNALPAATRYAELERAARDADEGIASLTNWLHNVTPSPGLEDLVRSCSAADMTPHDAYEHGRILRRFDIAAALRPHIEILARISDAIANLDKEQVDG